MAKETLTGRCQCGAAQYEVANNPIRVTACHCTDCQQQSGSAFGLTMVVVETDFRLTAGTLKTVDLPSDSGRPKFGAFCPECGSWIYHKTTWSRSDVVSIKAGTLDDTSWVTPDMHLWTIRKQPWVIIPDGAETYDTQPS